MADRFDRGDRSHPDAPVFVISVAAGLAGMHPQTLRQYDRLGLVTPGRSAGRGRRYSPRDVERLREVQRLSQEEGINLVGVKRIIALETRVAELQAELVAAQAEADRRESDAHASYRRELVPVNRGAVMVWQPHRRRR